MIDFNYKLYAGGNYDVKCVEMHHTRKVYDVLTVIDVSDKTVLQELIGPTVYVAVVRDATADVYDQQIKTLLISGDGTNRAFDPSYRLMMTPKMIWLNGVGIPDISLKAAPANGTAVLTPSLANPKKPHRIFYNRENETHVEALKRRLLYPQTGEGIYAAAKHAEAVLSFDFSSEEPVGDCDDC